MKTILNFCRRHIRRGVVLPLLAMLVLLTGCFETQRIFWSPDGQQAAVLNGDGLLHLTDAQGRLSGLLLSNVETVAWFEDSQRLVLARQETYTNWAALAAMLPDGKRDEIRQLANALLVQLEAGKALDQIGKDVKPEEKPLLDACALYGRDEQSGRVRNAFKNSTNNLDDAKAELHAVQIARVVGGQLKVSPPLAREFSPVLNLRLSRDGRAVAYTCMSEDESFYLAVVPTAGDRPASTVDDLVAAYPDWTTDSRSLAYIKAAVATDKKDLTLASLIRRQVVDSNNVVQVSSDKAELAGLLFNPLAKVRCLRDGRIIFAAAELHLPAATDDMPQREQFYALDPGRQATLTPLVPRGKQESLPESLSWFELSPDEKRIVAWGGKDAVALFTIATGDVTIVQPQSDKDAKSVPVWRSADELCYAVTSGWTNENHKTDLMLWRDGKTNLLSTNWPAEVRKGLLD